MTPSRQPGDRFCRCGCNGIVRQDDDPVNEGMVWWHVAEDGTPIEDEDDLGDPDHETWVLAVGRYAQMFWDGGDEITSVGLGLPSIRLDALDLPRDMAAFEARCREFVATLPHQPAGA